MKIHFKVEEDGLLHVGGSIEWLCNSRIAPATLIYCFGGSSATSEKIPLCSQTSAAQLQTPLLGVVPINTKHSSCARHTMEAKGPQMVPYLLEDPRGGSAQGRFSRPLRVKSSTQIKEGECDGSIIDVSAKAQTCLNEIEAWKHRGDWLKLVSGGYFAYRVELWSFGAPGFCSPAIFSSS